MTIIKVCFPLFIAFALQGCHDKSTVNYGYTFEAQMKEVAIYMDKYNNEHGYYPSDIVDETANQQLSWRVELEAFIEKTSSVNTSAAWCTADNLENAKSVPRVFSSRSHRIDVFPFECRTQVLGIISKEGFWNGTKDATGGVLLIDGQPVICVGVAAELGVFWTQPVDLSVDDAASLLTQDENRSEEVGDKLLRYAILQDGRVTEAPFRWELMAKK